eukprot:9475754-Pyramimonas_sp.AAC.1
MVHALGSAKGVFSEMKGLDWPVATGIQVLMDNRILKGVLAQRLCSNIPSAHLPSMKDQPAVLPPSPLHYFPNLRLLLAQEYAEQNDPE